MNRSVEPVNTECPSIHQEILRGFWVLLAPVLSKDMKPKNRVVEDITVFEQSIGKTWVKSLHCGAKSAELFLHGILWLEHSPLLFSMVLPDKTLGRELPTVLVRGHNIKSPVPSSTQHSNDRQWSGDLKKVKMKIIYSSRAEHWGRKDGGNGEDLGSRQNKEILLKIHCHV